MKTTHGIKRLLTFSLVLMLGLFNSSLVQAEDAPNSKDIKIALLLDTSNSMDGLIEQAKSQLWQMVNELSKARYEGAYPKLKIALYEYGNDYLPASEGYIRQVTPLTSDLDQLSADLFALKTNGGSEFCGFAIHTAIKEQDWGKNKDDLQLIFIAGNEPFNQGKFSYKQACADAKEHHIIVNTVHCGTFDEGVQGKWKEGALLTGGKYMCIQQDRKTVYIASPYDDRISALNQQLNKTYVAYGSLGKEKRDAQVQQDVNAASYSKVNQVKRAVSKSSHFYKNSSWDLVDAVAEDEVAIETLDEEQFPTEMQGMSSEERIKYIEDKQREREEIQKEIQVLNGKRQEFVKQQQIDRGAEVLDQVMIKSIKEQAALKNFKFE